MTSATRDAGPANPERRLLADRSLAALDGADRRLVSAACVLYLAVGGYDLGFASVRRFSKPFLVLLVLGALRAAIPPPVLAAAAAASAPGRASADAAATLGQRTPWAAAAFDALVAVLTVHLVPKATAFPRERPLPGGAAAPLPDAVRVGEARRDLRGVGLGLVLRHRPARLLLEPLGPEQHRVLPPLPDADAGAGLALRGQRPGAVDLRDRALLRVSLPGARGPPPADGERRSAAIARPPDARSSTWPSSLRLLLHAGLHRVALPADERLRGGRRGRLALGLGRALRRARRRSPARTAS